MPLGESLHRKESETDMIEVQVKFTIDSDSFVIADNNFEELKKTLQKYGCENITVTSEEVKQKGTILDLI